MEPEQGDQQSRLGQQNDSGEAPEMFLGWITAAAAVILLLLVAAVLATQEQVLVADVEPRNVIQTNSPTVTPVPAQAVQSPTLEPTVLPAATGATSASLCETPPGWLEYRIKWGDSLSGLASKHGLSVKVLKEANCLQRNTIFAGSALWVPSGTGTAGTLGTTPVVSGSPTDVTALPPSTPTRTQAQATGTPVP
jgi:LysM repeat protein